MIGGAVTLVFWILSMIVFFLVLHWVIRSAINSSQPAQQLEDIYASLSHSIRKAGEDSEAHETLKEIRDLLKSGKDGR